MPPRPIVPHDDLYARLEVPPDASFEAIEIAWRALLKRHHPDIAGAETLELAKRINVAHDWLGNPQLRARYDLERRLPHAHGPGIRWDAGRSIRRWPTDASGPAPRARPSGGAPVGPAETLRRFLERVGRLTPDELARLAVAETTSIAFVASIRRFLAPSSVAALDAVEAELRQRLTPAAWASPTVRDAILAAAHEIVLGSFLDDHLSEPFRGRARDRLLRGWEAAVDQPRYGPNTRLVQRFLARVKTLGDVELRGLAGAVVGRIPPDPWPRGIDPEEDEALRVSSALAGRDAVARAAAALAALDRTTASRATRLLRRTAHALVLRHAFSAADFSELIRPWQGTTNDPGTGWRDEERAEATVRRR
jgi:curved DNA-binding protein CbpA